MTIFFSKVEAEIARREQQERVPLSRFFLIEDRERSHVNNCEEIDINNNVELHLWEFQS